MKVPRSLKSSSPTELITALGSRREKTGGKIRTRVNFHFTDDDGGKNKDKDTSTSSGSVMQSTSLVKNVINHTPPRQRYLHI